MLKTCNFILFQSGAGGGMSSSAMPMSRPTMGGMDGNVGGYAGANDMTNNGLSANQNQVSLNKSDSGNKKFTVLNYHR